MKVSFCVHAYNEAEAVERLVRSSLPLAHLVGEWVVVDHRSTDDTQTRCERIRQVLTQHGIRLTLLREPRDFSPSFTFAALRTQTIRACSLPIVVIHDADFVIGPAFGPMLERSIVQMGSFASPFYGAAFTVPVVWDRIETDAWRRIMQEAMWRESGAATSGRSRSRRSRNRGRR